MTHNIYGKYVLNYANASEYWKERYHCEGRTPHHLFVRAFLWDKTPEGDDYWQTIDRMWTNTLKLDLKIDIV